jgi:hypothetical protein
MTNLHNALSALQNKNLAERLSAVQQIMAEVKQNPVLMQKFQTDPRRLLGAFGFNEDLQRELIGDKPGLMSDCMWTCWSTCSYTCNNTSIGPSPEVG